MKIKSMIRVLLGMTFMVCLCHIGFAQKKAMYNGIPMRNAYSSSLKYPVYLHIFVGDEIGRPLAHVEVAVYYLLYAARVESSLREFGCWLEGRTPRNGEIYLTKITRTIKSTEMAKFLISIEYRDAKILLKCRLGPGPTYIEIKINSRTSKVTGEVTYPNNEKETF